MFAAIYLMYAKLEEEHGLPRRALDKYDRATRVVLPEDRYEVSSMIIIIIMKTFYFITMIIQYV